MPFDEQKELIDSIRAEIDPPGTEQRPAGGRERGGRRAAGAGRRRQRGTREQPLPAHRWPGSRPWRWRCWRSIARRGGRWCRWSRSCSRPAGRRSCLALAGVPLNPMSATLGALVIAIATEFSVLLAARYEEERGGGAARRGGASPRLLAHRHGGARLRDHGDRRLRGADRDRHPHAARLRPGHGARPRRRAGRRAAGPAGRAGLGRDRVRAVPALRPATPAPARAGRAPDRENAEARAAGRPSVAARRAGTRSSSGSRSWS